MDHLAALGNEERGSVIVSSSSYKTNTIAFCSSQSRRVRGLSQGAGKSKMKVLADSVSVESLLPSFQMAVFLLCPHMPFLDAYTSGDGREVTSFPILML